MTDGRHGIGHLTDQRIQEWLDGQISQREAARVQTHLDGCARCRAEAEVWRDLIADLSSLPALVPAANFSGRVLDEIIQETGPSRWALTARAWLGQTFGGRADHTSVHPGAAALQDFLEGALRGRQSTRLRRHLAACESCRREAMAWRAIFAGLDALPQLAPSASFAGNVMARVRLPEPAPVRITLLRRALDQARALADPRRRRAWAAAAGVALTPMLTTWVIAYAVFSQPLVTVGNLGAFAWLKGSTLAGTLGNSIVAGLMDNAAVFRTWMALGSLTSSPATVAVGLLVFSILTLAAAWVLHRNLFSASAEHAHVKIP